MCAGYSLCRIAEKSEHQLQYCLSPVSKNVFLRACPGSGKTEVVGLKAAYEIKEWNKNNGGIAVLTFTNNAATVIRERISQFLGNSRAGFPHYIGTIDSWLHGYVTQPFAHSYAEYLGLKGDCSFRLIDSSSTSGFLNAYSTKYNIAKTGKILGNQYCFDLETDAFQFSSSKRSVDAARNRTDLKDWEVEDLWNAKERFWKSGFCTYQDMEFFGYEILDDKETAKVVAKRFPLILVDECQDLSWVQLQILKKLNVAGSKMHFVGDLNQSIYWFKKVNPKKVEDYTVDNGFTQNELGENFRSCQTIVNLCQQLVDGRDVKSKSANIISQPCLCVFYKPKNISLLTNWFEGYLVDSNIDIVNSAIIARGWSTVGKLRPSGSNLVQNYQMQLAMSFFLWKSNNTQSLEDSLRYLGQFISNKILGMYSSNSQRYFCPEFIDSSVMWRQLLCSVLEECSKNHEKLFDLDAKWSDWVKVIRRDFNSIFESCFRSFCSDFDFDLSTLTKLDGNSFRVISGSSNEIIANALPSVDLRYSKSRITTIHSVKGETLDAAMLVSAPTAQGRQGGHWREWLADKKSENARFAYVASSRPKHLLVWAVPTPTKKDQEIIENLGFHIIEEVGSHKS